MLFSSGYAPAPPYAPSHLSCTRRFEYYLCHSTCRQTFFGLLLPLFFGNMLITIDERKHSHHILAIFEPNAHIAVLCCDAADGIWETWRPKG
jgi:hypothetical protein